MILMNIYANILNLLFVNSIQSCIKKVIHHAKLDLFKYMVALKYEN